jgi:phospholipase C
LPYRFAVEPIWSDAGLTLRFENRGPVGIVFGVQDETMFSGWRYFTVAAASHLEEAWPLRRDRPHAIVVRGPDGFHREFRGQGNAPRIEAAIVWREDGTGGTLRLANRGEGGIAMTLHCAHRGTSEQVTLPVGSEVQRPVLLADHRWYDLMLTGENGARVRLAGHVETGAPGVSEPALAFPHPA